jgi:hypothetical protein
MKTKTKLLFAIGFIAVLCIGFLIGISVNFPKPDNSDLAGTFGKAEKFHKVQMTAKDIELRSELLKDTARLRSMIQGLVYFSIFTGDVCADIDLTIVAFKAKGMGSQAGEGEIVKALQDYSDFIRNNNKTLNSTITLLSGFYLNDTANLSLDVEKNLKDFGAYVNGLNQKNMVLSQALKSIDNFMLTGKTLQTNTKEITQLKSIRDQLLIKGLQLGGLIGNKDQVSSMIECALGVANMNAVNSKGEIQASLVGFGVILAQDLAGVVLSYSPSSLEFSVIFSQGQVGQAVNAAGNIPNAIGDKQILALYGKETLNIILSNYSMSEVYNSQALTGNLSANAMYGIFAANNVQSVFQSSAGFNSMYNSMGSNYLGLYGSTQNE